MQKDANVQFSTLKVDGGASENNLLMQIQANVLNASVIRPKTTETTAMGAAFLAGLASGFWKNTEELKKLWEKDRAFQADSNHEIKKIVSLWEERMQKIVNNES